MTWNANLDHDATIVTRADMSVFLNLKSSTLETLKSFQASQWHPRLGGMAVLCTLNFSLTAVWSIFPWWRLAIWKQLPLHQINLFVCAKFLVCKFWSTRPAESENSCLENIKKLYWRLFDRPAKIMKKQPYFSVMERNELPWVWIINRELPSCKHLIFLCMQLSLFASTLRQRK